MPRKRYRNDELDKFTLKQAGLSPSGSIVLVPRYLESDVKKGGGSVAESRFMDPIEAGRILHGHQLAKSTDDYEEQQRKKLMEEHKKHLQEEKERREAVRRQIAEDAEERKHKDWIPEQSGSGARPSVPQHPYDHPRPQPSTSSSQGGHVLGEK